MRYFLFIGKTDPTELSFVSFGFDKTTTEPKSGKLNRAWP